MCRALGQREVKHPLRDLSCSKTASDAGSAHHKLGDLPLVRGRIEQRSYAVLVQNRRPSCLTQPSIAHCTWCSPLGLL